MASVVDNHLGAEVLTPTGWRSFDAVNKVTKPCSLILMFEDGTSLECSLNHPIKDKNGVFVLASNYIVGESVMAESGLLKIIKIDLAVKPVELYDLLSVDRCEYYTNGVLSHNCKFLSSEPLLINSLALNRLVAKTPAFEDSGFKFWHSISPKKTYLVGVDVSEGLGKDSSTIQVFEASTLTQVAEFKDSSYTEAQLYDKLKWLFKYILSKRDPQGNKPTLLWSFENNACGKVISTLYYNDAEFPEDAELVSTGGKLGMNTSASTKGEACALLKRLAEGVDTMVLNSADLVTELKTYAQSGSNGTFAAQPGGTDDLVSACLIIARLVKHAASYDDEAFDRLYRGKGSEQALEDEVYDDNNAEDAPMPVVF